MVLNNDLRFQLEGVRVWEWTWFNGFSHISHGDGYVEAWVYVNDTLEYGYGNFSWTSKWSGFGFWAMADGFDIWWPEHDINTVHKIHVYLERKVDDHPLEIYDKVFNTYLINEELSSDCYKVCAGNSMS